MSSSLVSQVHITKPAFGKQCSVFTFYFESCSGRTCTVRATDTHLVDTRLLYTHSLSDAPVHGLMSFGANTSNSHIVAVGSMKTIAVQLIPQKPKVF